MFVFGNGFVRLGGRVEFRFGRSIRFNKEFGAVLDGRAVVLSVVDEAGGGDDVELDAVLVTIEEAEGTGLVDEVAECECGFGIEAEFGIVFPGVEAFAEDGIEKEDAFDVDDAVFAPAGGGEVFDEVPFDEVGGLVVVDVGLAAELEFGFVFAGEADVEGAEAMFEGVEAGAGFAFEGCGAGAFFGIGAVGGELAPGEGFFAGWGWGGAWVGVLGFS